MTSFMILGSTMLDYSNWSLMERISL